MKRFLILLGSALVMMSFAAEQVEVQDFCNSAEAKSKAKEAIKPYVYEAAKTTRFRFKNKKQFKEMEILLYMNQKYRFVFNTQGMDQPVLIEVFDKKFEKTKRELLFSTSQFAEDQTQFVFEPVKQRKIYIDYVIPPTLDTVKKACIVLAMGYLDGEGESED